MTSSAEHKENKHTAHQTATMQVTCEVVSVEKPSTKPLVIHFSAAPDPELLDTQSLKLTRVNPHLEPVRPYSFEFEFAFVLFCTNYI